jgi:hypothetical protein
MRSDPIKWGGEDKCIRTSTAYERVTARVPIQEVVTSTATQRIVASLANQNVVVIIAEQVVIACAANQKIVASITVNSIVQGVAYTSDIAATYEGQFLQVVTQPEAEGRLNCIRSFIQVLCNVRLGDLVHNVGVVARSTDLPVPV